MNAPAAAHAVDLLALLGRYAAPVPASVIARDLELPRSSVYHLLAVLQDRGFVVHLPDERRYGLGTAAYELGSAYSRQEPLRWVARTVLTQLVAQTTYSGHFAVLDGRDVVYLLEERGAGRASLVTEVGVRLPAPLTASGLALLAALPARQISALWPSHRDLVRRTENGPESLTGLRRELLQTRKRGWAYEHGYVTPGMASLATAVLDHNGRPQASLAVTFPEQEVEYEQREVVAGYLKQASTRIARHIYGRQQ